jgi:hypothetical protein
MPNLCSLQALLFITAYFFFARFSMKYSQLLFFTSNVIEHDMIRNLGCEIPVYRQNKQYNIEKFDGQSFLHSI